MSRHIGKDTGGHASNKIPPRETLKYWERASNRYRVREGIAWKHRDKSKYMPHHGKREIARGLRRQQQQENI